ncbi:MAG: hypothetical protein KF861_02170 [Planctomycetaceae bacterium]|nr:hypothetical protein [Planctomycetaceae bacterium]
MAERKSLEGLTLRDHDGTRIMALGDMEIWDGADLSLLRDGMNHVILKERHRSIAVDMSHVKYVPSGFFGMLFDWFDKGVMIRLYAPQERVVNMLWFRQFFEAERNGWYAIHNGLRDRMTVKVSTWQEESWDARDSHTAPVTAGH